MEVILLRKSFAVAQPRRGSYCHPGGGDYGEEERGIDPEVFGRPWKMGWTCEREERRCVKNIIVFWTVYLPGYVMMARTGEKLLI